MIVVKIMGGLGNQLFQYAFGQAVAEKYDCQVKYDLSYYNHIPEGDTVREVFVSRYMAPSMIAAQEDIAKITKWDKCLWKKIGKRLGITESRTKYESPRDGISSIEQVKDNTLLVGYWQSEDYFANVADKIRKIFSFDALVQIPELKDLSEKIRSVNSISIHVRGGDYRSDANSKIFGGICTSTYYEKAFSYMNEMIPDGQFFLFTNDIAWTMNTIHLPYEKITIVCEDYEATEDWMDLYLMCCCKHNIIANSSYSWWGAWLNTNKNKIVVCPSRWKNESADERIFGKEWIRISRY